MDGASFGGASFGGVEAASVAVAAPAAVSGFGGGYVSTAASSGCGIGSRLGGGCRLFKGCRLGSRRSRCGCN